MDEYGESPYAKRVKRPIPAALMPKEAPIEQYTFSIRQFTDLDEHEHSLSMLEKIAKDWPLALKEFSDCDGCTECGAEAQGIGDS